MVTIKHQIASQLKEIIKDLTDLDVEVQLEHPANQSFGDYSTNVAMVIFPLITNHQSLITNPKKLAEKIVEECTKKYASLISSDIEKVEIAGPGFINFKLSKNFFINQLQQVLKSGRIDFTAYVRHSERSEESQERSFGLRPQDDKRVMVEYAHPNTHKEMHIGHMRTLITGEAIARLLERVGAKVFRANYQGDIGPHVAKAIYGVQKLLTEEKLSLDVVDKWDNKDKAHFLGKAYAAGNQDYKEHKEEIDGINAELYRHCENPELSEGDEAIPSGDRHAPIKSGLAMTTEVNDLVSIYQTTRQWSLDYFDKIYNRFYTKFDRLFFESGVADCGKKIVLENIGKVFEKDQGATVFKGEKYGLHTRVFLTTAGYPTYEGKDMCLAFRQYEVFPFDKIIHIVANEQAGYFKVIIKALELIDPKKFKDSQYHLSMGMVQLVGKKMSSRTGDVLTVDWLIDQVKRKVSSSLRGALNSSKGDEASSKGDRFTSFAMTKDEEATTVEQIAIGAIKYSILKVSTEQNAMFNINTSVSLEGDSGPYIQYTYARTRSVLSKINKDVILNLFQDLDRFRNKFGMTMVEEEVDLLRLIYLFPEVVGEAALKYAPNILCSYLFDLAQAFNLFYQRVPILKPEVSIDIHLGGGSEATPREFRVALTMAVSQILKEGLTLLGIEAPERM